ncbi:MAG TPA: hypothetical protein VLE69_04235 [Candidatus Saccharimonadales bacterium]|nr:hypothetical protein [Candidatus Saccharimonadales bacterium]
MEQSREAELAAIRARIEADRPAREARIALSRQHEIPAIQARIEADRPAREARIAWAREHELPVIHERVEASRAEHGITSTGTTNAVEALDEALSHTRRAGAGLRIAGAVHNLLDL